MNLHNVKILHRQADGIQAGHRRHETRRWLQGENQLPKVIGGVRFQHGMRVVAFYNKRGTAELK
jgi:hypothetical protein